MELDNLCTLECLEESEILKFLEERYSNSIVYTKCGMILVSINPYKESDLYSEEVGCLYRNGIKHLQPHIYRELEQCIRDQKLYGEHTIIINGDSGAGKTECARRILEYLKIPALGHVDYILESMGNCKTKFNDNSSRFGKLIKINECPSIQTFLLEKSRVTDQSTDEQNFHIFYYILAKQNRKFKNRFINFQNGIEVDKLCSHYEKLIESFKNISLDFQVIERIVIGILYLGSISIENNKITENEEFEMAIDFLNLNRMEFEKFILSIDLQIGSDYVVKQLTDDQSYLLLASFARQLYSSLFNFIVNKINETLQSIRIPDIKLNILDIFGFESFERNGLDQFCINWCNERIHDHFIKDTFNYQRDILIEEGIEAESVLKECVIDNSSLEIIEKKLGLIDLIDEETFIGGTATNLKLKIENYTNVETKTPYKVCINHYNGTVIYELEDFVNKNREKLAVPSKIFDCCQKNEFINYFTKLTQNKKSLVVEFKKSLNSLFEIIKSTRVKYIKCIKPNLLKKPDLFDQQVVYSQLKNSGIFQVITLSKHLFPYMLSIEDFSLIYPFIDFTESYLTKGKSFVFFNYDGFNELERRRIEVNNSFRHQIQSFCKYVINKRYLNNIIASESVDRNIQSADVNHIQLLCRFIISQKYNHDVIMSLKPMNEDILTPNQEEYTDIADILKENKAKCAKIIKIIESDVLNDIECVNSFIKEEHSSGLDFNSEIYDKDYLRNLVKELSEEIKTLQQMQRPEILSTSIFSNSQSLDETAIFNNENFIKMKEKFKKLVFEENSTSEKVSMCFVFSSIIDLFSNHIPSHTGNGYDTDKILCFAQCILYILSNSKQESIKDDFMIFSNELTMKIQNFENQKSTLLFFLSNLIELKALIIQYLSSWYGDFMDFVVEELDLSIKTFSIHFVNLCNQNMHNLVPNCILDSESLKKTRRNIFSLKKIFKGPSISKLTEQLESIYKMCNFYCLPTIYTFSLISNILTNMDNICFNSLLIRKKFLNLDKCYQIKYNLAEIEKFCFNIGCRDIFLSLSYTIEALRVASSLGRIELLNLEYMGTVQEFDERTSILKAVNDSFLNEQQINSIIILFNYETIAKLPELSGRPKFISSQPLKIPLSDSLKPISHFVDPSYLSFKSILKILRMIKE